MAASTVDVKRIEHRYVMVVGKTGAGKSSVANVISRCDDRFVVSQSVESCTNEFDHCEVEIDENGTVYSLRVMDTIGLFDTKFSISKSSKIVAKLKDYVCIYFKEGMNLILFVLRDGRFTPEEASGFKFIQENLGDDISEMSALVITNCDIKSEEAREKIIKEFKTNPLMAPTADFMKAGIYAVGFTPKDDYMKLPEGLKAFYEASIKRDREKLWDVIKAHSRPKLKNQLYQKIFWEKCTII